MPNQITAQPIYFNGRRVTVRLSNNVENVHVSELIPTLTRKLPTTVPDSAIGMTPIELYGETWYAYHDQQGRLVAFCHGVQPMTITVKSKLAGIGSANGEVFFLEIKEAN